MSFDADLVILGGGCAGLSLGVHLADSPPPGRRTLILESRSEYTNDRTWCSWRDQPHRFSHLISHEWSGMRVRSAQHSVHVDCAATPYQMLPAGAFYREAVQRIASCEAVTLEMHSDITAMPSRIAGGWRLETSSGMVTSKRVIDTRPPRRPATGDAILWQSFLGQEIECDGPVFDPTTVELMDFVDVGDGTVAFCYVLPVSPTRALFEYTVFSPRPLSAIALGAAQRAALLRTTRHHSWVVLRQESGTLPMGLTGDPPPLPGPDYVRVGLMSGAARPSTGYAFQRIQRWASSAAASLRRDQFDVTHRRDAIGVRLMDQLFLRVMLDQPTRAPELFLRMFGNVDPIRMIRFLSDHGTAIDYAAVIATLPIALFLAQLCKSVPGAVPVLRGAR